MDIQTHLNSITQILTDIGERVEGNVYCDIQPTNITADGNKLRNLRSLCMGKTKICEVGVNACHSLLFMLDVNSEAEYTLFDIGIHKYLEPCFNYVQSAFPATKMKLFLGDSRLTLPAYAETHREEFDFIHVDGGHTYDVFSSDYECTYKMLKKGGIMIFDDYNHSEIKQFVDEKVRQGEVLHLTHQQLFQTDQHALLVKV